MGMSSWSISHPLEGRWEPHDEQTNSNDQQTGCGPPQQLCNEPIKDNCAVKTSGMGRLLLRCSSSSSSPESLLPWHLRGI